ncbi:Proline dehydrogenase [Denitrovibrio acetiphilus DSM 12809]|uniref:proline dehydrogenase n=1 Tax=Denitrovibrio acetiphilus (strain DSM 12809 / NBRC 114555 / N2460) TaxID=522772 RepID=D4H8C8_DENA2|nr:proline dehydrogenase family protein [Denitrovibrio acetiphilus]ADD68277.1 Proline dehydrogenase [Denitrovibrio acetiphilus DSM 12809]
MINTVIANMMPFMPKSFVRFFAKRYVAGGLAEDAFLLTRELNDMGAVTTIDLLGEFNEDPAKARATVDMYKHVLDSIKEQNLDGNISIKPTALGALVSMEFCTENITELVKYAHEKNIFVRIDMENNPYTDYTIDLYLKLDAEMPGSCGTVIQSCMRRTLDDLKHITSTSSKANIRLCKGIYKEPSDVAFQGRKEVQENFMSALDLLFSKKAYVGIATHDDVLINGAYDLLKKHNLKKEEYEFQMLLGVRSELRKRLLAEGHTLRVYAPFGEDWIPYSIRRLQENPAIVGSAIKGFLTGGR